MQDDKAFDRAMAAEGRAGRPTEPTPENTLSISMPPKEHISDFAKAHRESTRKQRPPRKLIFLSGFANTGKDTVFNLLSEISPEPVKRISFADALKTECYPTLGKEYDPNNDDREWKDAHRTEIIQYGEGQKMKNGQNYWLKRALDEELNKEYDREIDIPHIIVTDARRTEEIMWFKHYKIGQFEELKKARAIWEPVMFVVHREGAESDSDYLTHVCLEYAAETRTFLGIIKNYGTVKELTQQLKDLYVRHIR